MGFRFRKSIKLLPGPKINLSKSGISFTLGKKGCKTNIKPGKSPKTTFTIPKTGIPMKRNGVKGGNISWLYK